MASKVLEHDASACSYTQHTIAGIKTSIFNLSKLPEASAGNPREVAVLYVLHGRLNSNKFSESVAFNVVETWKEHRQKSTLPLICISFDLRNHGERLTDALRNESWANGNATHAVDMCSVIDGTVQDCKLLMDYLPALYPGYSFRNFVTGTSLGGHVCYRLATAFPRSIEAIIPVVGCTDLCTLLINRVKGIPVADAARDLRKLAYEDLQLTEAQKALWPEYFHNYLSKQDFEIAEKFPNHVKVFAIFGEDDTVVPATFSDAWIQDAESARCYDGSVTRYIYKNVGHESTKGMCDAYSRWLLSNITPW